MRVSATWLNYTPSLDGGFFCDSFNCFERTVFKNSASGTSFKAFKQLQPFLGCDGPANDKVTLTSGIIPQFPLRLDPFDKFN